MSHIWLNGSRILESAASVDAREKSSCWHRQKEKSSLIQREKWAAAGRCGWAGEERRSLDLLQGRVVCIFDFSWDRYLCTILQSGGDSAHTPFCSRWHYTTTLLPPFCKVYLIGSPEIQFNSHISVRLSLSPVEFSFDAGSVQKGCYLFLHFIFYSFTFILLYLQTDCRG